MTGKVSILWLMALSVLSFSAAGPSAASAAAPDFPNTEIRIKVSRWKIDSSIKTIFDHQGFMTDPVTGRTVDVSYSSLDIYNDTHAFRTPDLGTTYTLASLAAIAGNFLQTTTTGFLLRDQVIVSPHDGLLLTSETLLVGNQYWDDALQETITPRLVARGRLRAENFTMKSATRDQLEYGPGTDEHWQENGWGLVINGQGFGRAEATLTSCSFNALLGGVVVYNGARAAITNSSFRNCGIGLNVTSFSQAIVQNCHLEKAKFTSIIGTTATLANSTFQECGALFLGGLGAVVRDCSFDGPTLFGVGASITPHLIVQRNHINHVAMGVYLTDSGGLLEDNTIENCSCEGIICAWNSPPKVRRNILRHNAADPMPLSANQATTVAGVAIYGNASPDFGTLEDPGRNAFIDNGPFTFYHAGATTETVHAVGNDWGTATTGQSVESLIYHQPDDASDSDKSGFISGQIIFAPLLNGRSGLRPSDWLKYH